MRSKLCLSLTMALVFVFLSAQGVWAATNDNHSPMRHWASWVNLPAPHREETHPASLKPDQEIEALMKKYNPRLKENERSKILQAILDSSERWDLDPLLVSAVIAAESSFQPLATSRCDARGLMQLTRMVWPWLGVTDPYDIMQNIEGGCRFLATQQKRFKALDLTLAAYNAGPGIVGKLKRVPDYQETIQYVKKVSRLKKEMTTAFEFRQGRAEAIYLTQNYQKQDLVARFIPQAHETIRVNDRTPVEESGVPAEAPPHPVEQPAKFLPEQRRLFPG